MKILYVSSYTFDERIDNVQKCLKDKLMNFQVQKFHKLIIEGLKEQDVKIDCFSTCSILSKLTQKKYLKKEICKKNNINFYCHRVLFIPILQFIYSFFASFFFCLKWCIKNENTVIICDVLETFQSAGVLLASKLCRCKILGIVTDLPWDLVGRSKSNPIKKWALKCYKCFTKFIVNRYSMYLLLTEQMNECVNMKKKPYVVIEGLVNNKMETMQNSLENKYKDKVVIFAGFLEKVHGVEMLVEAFSQIHDDNIRLHIYGSGNSVSYIEKQALKDNRIKYFGVVENNIVVEEELKATLLVNPRLTDNYFTKYSFPSKNMEYMVSGTPILTTKLPGMPKEYYDFIYTIDNESVEGVKEALISTLSKPKNILNQYGLNAKQFVLNNKSNIIQTKKLLCFINKNI